MEYPCNLPKEEAIRRIRQIYNAEVNLENENFDVYDQLLACESIQESEDEERRRSGLLSSRQEENITANKESVNVKCHGNGGCKLRVNFGLNESKLRVIKELQECRSVTPPLKVAELLEEFFVDYSSDEGHWLYIAQTWNPREINRVLACIVKLHKTGAKTIQNPPGFFTYLIKFRSKKRGRLWA